MHAGPKNSGARSGPGAARAGSAETLESAEAALEELALGALGAAEPRAFALFEAAWPCLIERLGVFLRALGVREESREDCGQNALLRVWKARGNYRGASRGELLGWIYRIVQRESVRLGESRARQPLTMTDRMPLQHEVESESAAHVLSENSLRPSGVPTSGPDAGLLATERQRALDDCIAELAPREREVVELCYAGDPLPERQAARLLGVSKSYVNVLRRQALAGLRACLQRKGIAQ